MIAIGSGSRSLLRNSTFGVASRLVNIALRLVYVVVLARMLGTADYGLYIYALSWYVLFMPLTAMGQDLILSREIGGGGDGAQSIVAATFALGMSATLIVYPFVTLLGWVANPGDEGRLLVIMVSFAMLPRSLALWCNAVFLSYERSQYVLRQDLIFRPLEIVLGLLVLMLGGGVLLLAFVHVLSWILQAAVGFSLVRSRFVQFTPSWQISGHRQVLVQGVHVGLGRVMAGWFISGPVVLFRHLSDDLDALGLVALCSQVMNLLRIVPSAISAAAVPILSRNVTHKAGKELIFLRGLILLAVAQAASAALLLMLTGESLLVRSVGPDYSGAMPYITAVCWMAVLPALGLATEKVLGIGNRTKPLLVSSLAGGGVMLSLAWGWAWTAGLSVGGVLLATAIGSLVWTLSLAFCLGSRGWFNAVVALGAAAGVFYLLTIPS